jgi:hypothetical protein
MRRWKATEEMKAKEEEKQKEKKRETKQKKEQKRKEKNAELRRRTEAKAITNRQAEHEEYDKEAGYYHEECACFEEQYDDEQCAIYHQNYIEETLNDIRKRLYQRSQPARTLRHRQQIGEGNAATKEEKGRTSDGDTDHHLRDGATARTKDQGRQEEE